MFLFQTNFDLQINRNYVSKRDRQRKRQAVCRCGCSCCCCCGGCGCGSGCGCCCCCVMYYVRDEFGSVSLCCQSFFFWLNQKLNIVYFCGPKVESKLVSKLFCCICCICFGLTDGRKRTQCLLKAEKGPHRSTGELLTCDVSAFDVSCVR